MSVDPNKYPLGGGGCPQDAITVRTKVEEDIAFLKARILALEAHPRPNRAVLLTYQNMLSSRIAVLKWLLDGARDSEPGAAGTRYSA